LPTLENKRKMDGTASEALLSIQLCRHCTNEIANSARFCDRCGMVNAALTCRRGNELTRFDRFCGKCGRSLILT
jgi:ribosomal protein L40E